MLEKAGMRWNKKEKEEEAAAQASCLLLFFLHHSHPPLETWTSSLRALRSWQSFPVWLFGFFWELPVVFSYSA